MVFIINYSKIVVFFLFNQDSFLTMLISVHKIVYGEYSRKDYKFPKISTEAIQKLKTKNAEIIKFNPVQLRTEKRCKHRVKKN